MEALQIELYASIAVGLFMVGMGIYIYRMVVKKMNEGGDK